MIQEIIRRIEEEIAMRIGMPHPREQVDICYGLNRAKDIVLSVEKDRDDASEAGEHTIQQSIRELKASGMHGNQVRQETLGDAIVALEKQAPKKVPDMKNFGRCPDCDAEFDSELINDYGIEYCPWCGQVLDFSEWRR